MNTAIFNNHDALRSEKGIALMMVIWVLTIMIVIVLSFSMMSRTNAFSTLSFNEAVKRDYILEAGIQHGIMELFYMTNKCPGGSNPVAATTPAATSSGQNTAIIEEDCWKADGTEYSDKIGDVEYTVRITDEAGKIDINKADEIILRGLLTALEVNDDEIDPIVDAILDWRDPNSTEVHRLHGPGNEYYMSLPRPYKQKNADFDSVEELLLVKGVTKELFYGIEGKKKGLADLVTVYSKDKRINIYAAPKEVLRAIPGMGDDTIDSLMTLRGTGATDKTAQPVQGMGSAYIKTTSSNVFAIEASVKSGEKAASYGTKAIVSIAKTKPTVALGKNADTMSKNVDTMNKNIDATKKYSILYWKNPAFITPQ